MTISKYISEFITTYLDGVTIDTNHLGDGADKYGLFKSPARDVISKIDGSLTVTENYQFFVKQGGVSEVDRVGSDEFLENLAYWMDDFPVNYEYPPIDGDRTVLNISATGCPYSLEVDNNNEIVYQISLSITYIREREV